MVQHAICWSLWLHGCNLNVYAVSEILRQWRDARLHLSPSPKANTSEANRRLLSIKFEESALLCSKRADTKQHTEKNQSIPYRHTWRFITVFRTILSQMFQSKLTNSYFSNILLLMLTLQPTMGFSLLGDFLPFRPFLTQFSPPSYSHCLDIFLNDFNQFFPLVFLWFSYPLASILIFF